ncbi:MAG: hypothetical protein OEV64_09590, partial [Desulfobulbaceae bacterium]|nr:hypothetical protein [Desulfobulbaceae bacterium]
MRYKILSFIETNGSRIFFISTLFILIGGLGYSLYLGDDLRFPDERHYHLLAENLAGGLGYTFDGVTPSAWRTPGYPLFLAVFIKMGCSIGLLRYLNFLALAGGLIIIRSILRLEKHQGGTSISSLLILGYPVLFYTAGTLYPQTVFTFLLLTLFRLIITPRYGWIHGTLFGLVSAALIMLHPTA